MKGKILETYTKSRTISDEEMELIYNNGKGLYYPFKEKLETTNEK